MRGDLLVLAHHPLSTLALLLVVVAVGGLVGWWRGTTSLSEVVLAVLVVAWLIRLLARVAGATLWSWQGRGEASDGQVR